MWKQCNYRTLVIISISGLIYSFLFVAAHILHLSYISNSAWMQSFLFTSANSTSGVIQNPDIVLLIQILIILLLFALRKYLILFFLIEYILVKSKKIKPANRQLKFPALYFIGLVSFIISIFLYPLS